MIYGEAEMPGTTPPAEKSWSARGKLKMGNPDTTVGLQKLFDEPGTYTIMFDVSAQDNGLGDALFTEADIIWTVAGNQIRRRISIGAATSISGTAEGVQVTVVDRSVSGVLATFEYSVGITIAKGVRAPSSQPPVWVDSAVATAPGTTIAAGGSQVFPIPVGLGATSLFVLVGPQAFGAVLITKDVVVDEEGGGGFVLARYYPLITPNAVPLAPGTKFIKVWNTSAQNVVVTLFFGIDG